jgi:hypothetical protein
MKVGQAAVGGGQRAMRHSASEGAQGRTRPGGLLGGGGLGH